MLEEEEDEEFFDIDAEIATSSNLDSLVASADCSSLFTDILRTARTIYAVKFLNQGFLDERNSSCMEPDSGRIFINQEKAMNLCKQDPENRRFKAFKCFNEAYAFSYGIGPRESISQAKASFEASLNQQEKNSAKILTQEAEKLPFSAPKKPEVNELRSFIEKNLIDSFKKKVNSNPRFLISAGDSPVIVQVLFFPRFFLTLSKFDSI